MTRALALAALLLAGVACGKYGPPVRTATLPPPKTPPVAAAPATGAAATGAEPTAASNTEECADPNAPGAPNATAKAAP